jgi:hypothetical protein
MTPVQSCPDVKTLQLFQVGLLPEPESEALAQHFEGCSACVGRLETPPGPDALLDALYSGELVPETIAAPKALPGLIERARALHSALEIPPTRRPEDSIPTTRVGPLEAAERPRIGRYQILQEIGAGGMGSVYKGFDPDLQRLVAIKVPRFEGRAEESGEARRRFLQEARAAARVRHPHVCPIYDVGEHEGRPYVVMALVEGQSLARRLQRQGHYESCAEAVMLVRQVAEALQAVHDHGIIHRDLKPGNILLDSDGRPLLTDFGLARLTDTEHLTPTGALMGTPAYMAPEQIDSSRGAVGAPSDLYSLGVVLYHMLTGRLPHEGTIYEILHKKTNAQPPPPSHFRPDLVPELDAMVMKALAVRPEDRHGSVTAFAQTLAAMSGTLSGARSSEWRASPQAKEPAPTPPASATARMGPERVPGRARRKWWPWLAAAALCVGLLGAGAAYFLTRSAPPLKGWLDVRVWEPGQKRRYDRRLNQEGALPLKPGDLVRIEAELNRPAYVYILMIDTTGHVDPIYPWKPGDWTVRRPDEVPITRLSLPEEDPTGGWEVSAGPPGMETLVLLGRDTPLPRDVDLKALLAGLPPQKAQNNQSAVWFENGEVVRDEAERGFSSFDTHRIDDPVLATQELLKTRLGPFFRYSRAVSFAQQGQ